MSFLHTILTTLLKLDGTLLLLIQEHVRSDILNLIFVNLTKLGNYGILWLAISIILLFSKKTRRAGILSLLAVVSAYLLCNQVLKDYVGRIRPYEAISGLKSLLGSIGGYSFPSGHAAVAFASATAIAKSRPKRLGIPVVILACLMAFSRLYVGVHYPSDVIFGAIIGALIGLIFFWLFGERKFKKRERRKAKKRRS